VVCVALALLAGLIAAIEVAPLGPTLKIKVIHVFDMDSQDVFDLRITSHGGEVIDEVLVEVLRGVVRVAPPGRTVGLAPGIHYRARVNVAHGGDVAPAVRVIQKGRVEKTYDIQLGELTK
jgi:hypothetical protein